MPGGQEHGESSRWTCVRPARHQRVQWPDVEGFRPIKQPRSPVASALDVPDLEGAGEAREASRANATLVVRRDPNRVSWPPSRTDLLTLVLLIAFGYCLMENRSFVVTVPVLFGTVFCGVSPRMKGRFGWQGSGGSSLGGEFDDPFESSKLAEVGESQPGALGRGSPPKTGSASG